MSEAQTQKKQAAVSIPPASRMSDADKLAAAEAKLKELQAQLDAVELQKNPPKPGVVKGSATYRLTKPHYRKGVLYEPGDLITVVDEVPGRSWIRVDPAEHEAAIVAKSASLFAAGRATPAPEAHADDEV